MQSSCNWKEVPHPIERELLHMQKIDIDNGTSPDVMHNWMQCKCDDSHCGSTWWQTSLNCTCTHGYRGHDVQRKMNRKNNYLSQIVFCTTIHTYDTFNWSFFSCALHNFVQHKKRAKNMQALETGDFLNCEKKTMKKKKH